MLYHLLNFAANFEVMNDCFCESPIPFLSLTHTTPNHPTQVDIVTKDMKQQLALANVDARTTRQSAAPAAASAALSSGKKRARCVMRTLRSGGIVCMCE